MFVTPLSAIGFLLAQPKLARSLVQKDTTALPRLTMSSASRYGAIRR